MAIKVLSLPLVTEFSLTKTSVGDNYSRDTTTPFLVGDDGGGTIDPYRFFAEYGISTLPSSATIERVVVKGNVNSASGGGTVTWTPTAQPSIASDNTLWTQVFPGSYGTSTTFGSSTGNRIIELSTDARDNIISQINASKDWFAFQMQQSLLDFSLNENLTESRVHYTVPDSSTTSDLPINWIGTINQTTPSTGPATYVLTSNPDIFNAVYSSVRGGDTVEIRSGVSFDISSIPANVTSIDNLTFHYRPIGLHSQLVGLQKTTVDPVATGVDATDGAAWFADTDDPATWYENPLEVIYDATTPNRRIELNADARADLLATRQSGQDWWSMGYRFVSTLSTNSHTVNTITLSAEWTAPAATATATVIRKAAITQTDKPTYQQAEKVKYTTLTIPNEGQTAATFQLAETSSTFKTPLFTLNSENKNLLRTNGNLKKLSKKKLQMFLKFSKDFQMRYKVKINGKWSGWSKAQTFTTRSASSSKFSR